MDIITDIGDGPHSGEYMAVYGCTIVLIILTGMLRGVFYVKVGFTGSTE